MGKLGVLALKKDPPMARHRLLMRRSLTSGRLATDPPKVSQVPVADAAVVPLEHIETLKLAELMLAAYRGTVDDEGEDLDDALTEIRATLSESTARSFRLRVVRFAMTTASPPQSLSLGARRSRLSATSSRRLVVSAEGWERRSLRGLAQCSPRRGTRMLSWL